MEFLANELARFESGEKGYWEAARAINSGGESRTTAVAVQQFLGSDGNLCTTPQTNTAAATAHFTKVFNVERPRPDGAEAAVDAVEQRQVRFDLDAPIELTELAVGEAGQGHVQLGPAAPT